MKHFRLPALFIVYLSLLLNNTPARAQRVRFVFDQTEEPATSLQTSDPEQQGYQNPVDPPTENTDTPTYRIYPPNTLNKDISLQYFLQQFRKAVKEQNNDFLLEMIHPDIKFLSKGQYQYGKDAFIAQWKADQKKTPLWFYFDKLLKMGGDKAKPQDKPLGDIVFPYVYNLNFDAADMYTDLLAITGKERVNLRKTPSLKGAVTGHLDHDIVKVDYEQSLLPSLSNPYKIPDQNGMADWYKVTSIDGNTSGYVNWNLAWNPYATRFFLTQSAGKWYLSAWMEGH